MSQPVHFSDIVLADVLTSFAKVIGDLWISACMLAPWGSLRLPLVDEGRLQWMVPCLMRWVTIYFLVSQLTFQLQKSTLRYSIETMPR